MSDGAGPTAWRLRPPAHRVAPRAVSWWAVRSLIGGLVLLVPQIVAYVVLDAADVEASVLLVTAAVTLAAAAVHLLVVPQVRFRVHRWERTDDAVHTLSGWLSREWRAAPIARVQTVDTEQGPLQRLFGLSTVTVTTASSSGPLRIDGLDAARAADLARDLTAAAHAVGGDAT